MAFRFRKNIQIVPGLKLNLNKKSVGFTIGGKGAHYTVNSSGRRTTSVGIPGTGISYSTSSSKKKDKTNNKMADHNFEIEELTPEQYHVAAKKGKRKLLLVTIFFGWSGAHYFMMHNFFMGILYLLTVGLAGFGWIIDIFRIALTSTKKDC